MPILPSLNTRSIRRDFTATRQKILSTAAEALIEKYGGEVPPSMDALVQLPGVGRKTANCVLSGAFNMTSGIVVDTHVARVSQRLGLTRNANPVKIETDLCQVIERKDWLSFGDALIQHGRQICGARKPQCGLCILNSVCPSSEA